MGLAPLAAGATLIGGGISTYSQIKAGKMQNAIDKRNAGIMEDQAARNHAEAAENVMRGRDNNRRIEATETSRNALSGVTGPSVELMEAEASFRRELELQDLYRSAGVERRALEDQATMTRFSGQQSRKAGFRSAAGTLFSSVSGAASQYYQLGPKGNAGPQGTSLRTYGA